MQISQGQEETPRRIASAESIPAVPRWFQNGFHRFLRPYLRRHFDAIAIDRESRCDTMISDDEALIVYGNHPSWWDPLVAHFINRALFPNRQFYAPIDADALQRYQVFGKLGFYGVRLNTPGGAAAFLKQSCAILDAGRTAIWLTPEGRFSDVRDHSTALMPGLAHLCKRRNQGWVLPLAIEYVFWNERLPVCLARQGAPIRIADHDEMSKPQMNELLTTRLRHAQIELSKQAVDRRSSPFDQLLVGKSGAGMVYDSFRRMKAVVTGQKFQARHSEPLE